jgi:hypothetical protein
VAGRAAESLLAEATSDLDAGVGRPRHLPFTFWKSRALYPRAQALGAVEDFRSADYLPLKVVIGVTGRRSKSPSAS